ncbi:MAG: NAD(P)-binding protein, partial [Candidatus Latescibacteria bacterium]|nr:NAD(P)-binding protein [Candidatus Latescibacterota bacterium]
MNHLETKYVGLDLRSPIIVASAGITETVERIQKAQEYGAGAVVMKSLFEKEICRIAPTPRFRILKHNLGQEKTFTFMSYEQASEWDPQRYAEEVAKAKAELEIKIIPSINCVTDQGWVTYAKMMEEAGADALELNVSCPHSSVTFGGEDVENRIYQVVKLVRESVSLPIIPKLSSMLTNPLHIAKRLEQIGANGVTIFNRMTALDIDIENQLPTMPGGYAGHGGPWAIQYSLRWISAIRPQVEMDIAASGGVTSWEDVVKYLLAGATVVQVCTAVILNGYKVIEELCRGLEDYMIQRDYQSLDEFRGKVCGRILTTEEISREHTFEARIDPEPTAPCQVACPVAVPVQALVRLIAEGEFEQAWRQLKSKGPLQWICSLICPGFCERECTHTLVDRTVSIMTLKRFILNWGKNRRLVFEYLKAAEVSDKKVAVIGSGPAGLTAAFDLARAGHQVTIFEAQPVAGGMLSLGIPQFRLPRDLVRQEIAEIEEMGVGIKLNTPIDSLDALIDY